MRLKDWLKILEDFKTRRIKVVHISALQVATGLKKRSLTVVLNRLEKTGLIRRVAKGWICIQPCEIWEIIKTVFPSAYISLEWALHHHEILDQEIKIITMVWLGKTKTVKTKYYTFELHKIKPQLYFGYNSRLIADPEKALLDTIYIRKKLPAEINIELLNLQKLEKYAQKYPKKIREKLKSLKIYNISE